MSVRFRRRLLNELGRRATLWSHVSVLPGWSARRGAEELLRAAEEHDGRVRTNAVAVAFRLALGEMTDEELGRYVDLVEGTGAWGIARALEATDEMLTVPRLTEGQVERLRATDEVGLLYRAIEAEEDPERRDALLRRLRDAQEHEAAEADERFRERYGDPEEVRGLLERARELREETEG